MSPTRTVASVLSEPQKRLVALAIICGGSLALAQVRQVLHMAQKEQDALSAEVAQSSGKGKGKRKQTLTDKKFAARLMRILSICVPSPWSWEAMCILLQGGLLVSRTMLTEVVSSLEGTVGRHIMNANWPGFTNATLNFAACGIPAAVVNAGLKLMQKQIQLALSNRLTRHLHDKYCDNRAFYAASVLGGLTHADQRITEDVDNFCFAVSELYSYTFKPLLDVVLFTRTLSKTMGYKAQFGLYAYYILAGALLRHTAPPLARMVAQESALTGAFRAAHQRLVTSAEEVAFNDPPAGATEKMILNQHHRRLTRYLQLSSLQRFIQAVNDQYVIKYMASVMSLSLYALFQYFSPEYATLPVAVRTERYIKTVRLMGNTARGIGDLMMVYKRVAGLAGHTSRVSDLLEAVDRLSNESHHECFNRTHNASAADIPGQLQQALECGALFPANGGPGMPQQVVGSTVSFEGVAVDSPDGTPLVRNLTFSVPHGSSVIVMGPNGSGKSSLFRCLAGLWPHQAGVVTKPPRGSTIYLAQKPYLVSGSLRDQLLYPFPPRQVWAAVGPAERNAFPGDPELPSPEQDRRLEECLEEVELGYLLARQENGWDQVRNWQEILSGGEKQRLAMARLLYHKPQYAILDECTSAVSADGEVKLYQAVKSAGITALSIAHRPQLRRFHSTAIVFEGLSDANPNGWHREELNSDGTAAP